MKKKAAMVWSILLALSLAGCSAASAPSGESIHLSTAYAASPASASAADPLVQSYYAGQDSKAFGMFNKNIFKSSWYGDYKELKWNYDSFTTYATRNTETGEATGDGLYCCTFSAAEGKCGYIVISYSEFGPSLSKIRMVETPYLYDLKANLETISAGLKEAKVNPSTATASRVSLFDSQGGAAREAVYVEDEDGHQYTYYFESAPDV